MTAAPTDIPLDERGAPDLQLLVRKLGEAAAKERGEAYDPASAMSRPMVASVEFGRSVDRASSEESIC